MSGLKITLGSHEFNTDNGWSLNLSAGWWDDPELDMEMEPTISEGSALGRVMVRHRTVVGDGLVVTPTPEDHAAAHKTIQGLVSPYNTVPLVVDELDGPKQLDVRAFQPTRVRCQGRAIQFQLTLVATDPHKQPFDDEESS